MSGGSAAPPEIAARMLPPSRASIFFATSAFNTGQSRNDEITGCSPYGASTIAGQGGDRWPTENELAGARFQGRYVALVASKITPHRDAIIAALTR